MKKFEKKIDEKTQELNSVLRALLDDFPNDQNYKELLSKMQAIHELALELIEFNSFP